MLFYWSLLSFQVSRFSPESLTKILTANVHGAVARRSRRKLGNVLFNLTNINSKFNLLFLFQPSSTCSGKWDPSRDAAASSTAV